MLTKARRAASKRNICFFCANSAQSTSLREGSSFGDVFVAPDVFRADPAIRQQLCYVAVSRARTGVWLLGGETSPDLRATWQRQLDTTRDS